MDLTRSTLSFDMSGSQPTTCPGMLKIVPTSYAVNIDHLAAEIESRHFPALHGMGLDACKCNTTCGHELFFECSFTVSIKLITA